MNLEKLTMIIPVMERQQNIPFSMEYHKDWNCRKIIADSSFNPYVDKIEEGFEYLYYGPTVFFNKIYDIIDKYVDTEYIFVTSDDDVAYVECIEKCIDFLDKNSDYSICHGEWYWYKHGQIISNYNLNPGFTTCVDGKFYDKDPVTRIQKFFSCYYPCINAIVRTDVFKKSFKLMLSKKYHISAFGDRAFPLYALTYGNIKALPIPYIVQKYSDRVWGSQKLGEKLVEIYKDIHISIEETLTDDRLRPFADDLSTLVNLTPEAAFSFVKKTMLEHFANEWCGCVGSGYTYKITNAQKQIVLPFFNKVARNLIRNDENL